MLQVSPTRSFPMNEITPSNNPAPKWLRLVARIWSAPIIFITFFIAIGNLWSKMTNGAGDPYAVESATFLEALTPTLMFISAIGLALAWRWEIIGGMFSLCFTAVVFIVLLIQRGISGDLAYLIPYLLALIILIPGILFLVSGLKARKS
jgi:hypothetical protein